MNWTEGRIKSFITSTIRSGFRRWPPKYVVLANSYVNTKVNVKTKRFAKHYKCAKCKKAFPSKEVQVDHIKPVVSANGFTSWDDFIKNLFCSEENLQVLCKGCHSIKTKKETALRKKK